ncbi:MAG TPA: UbiX family flavin prenyltransferase [Phycisphaerae bacterium]|nr:UbiX family flavin prenyltransferase [Phycisphaerae bacterium]HRW53188.1 UbiX family flavin prenyltransferase [Phycisphaerae bacterium]
MSKRIVVAVTGASGAPYARRLLQVLAESNCDVRLVISPYGRRLFLDEMEIDDPTPEALVGGEFADRVTAHSYRDVGDVLASGSFLTDAMIVCPCSGNTLGEIAAGLGDNLISRAAAVHLKEARRLILVPREMPISPIELENMTRISRAGGIICPAAPGFYLRPRTIDELVDFVVGKLCDLVGVSHALNTRWEGAPPQAQTN